MTGKALGGGGTYFWDAGSVIFLDLGINGYTDVITCEVIKL